MYSKPVINHLYFWTHPAIAQEWIFVPPMVMETVGLDTASGQARVRVTFRRPKILVVENAASDMCEGDN